MTIPDAVALIVAQVRTHFPEWEGVDDDLFVAKELRYKKAASQLAKERLAEGSLRRLLAEGQADEVASRFIEVGKATNLLYKAAARQGDLAPLHDPAVRAATCGALVELLYGDGDVVERVSAFAEFLPAHGLHRNWPLATYFLYFVYPESEVFIKPEKVRSFLKVVGSPVELGTLNGEDYGHVRALAHELRDAMEDYGVRTMIDVQSLIWITGGGYDPDEEAQEEQEASSLVGKLEEDVRAHLHEFATIANAWFDQWNELGTYHDFFRRFFEPDHLSSLEWEDTQEVGRHLHSMQSMALARGNAFGRPNHEIEHYRRAFEYFARGEGPLAVRLDRLRTDEEVRLKYLGESALGEMAGQYFADEYSLFNERSRWALDFLGISHDESAGQSFGARFVAFSEAVATLIPLYRDVVGQRTDWPIRLEVDQFLSWVYETYRESEDVEVEDKTRSVWLISPGPGAKHWKANFEAGEVAIGWPSLGDLHSYSSTTEMAARLHEKDPAGPTPTNDARACWEFAHVIRKGDLVFAKRGRSAIVGAGTVTSDYEYEPARGEYCHVRRVDWTLKGEWGTGERQLPTKTLTGISKYPDMVAELKELVGIKGGEQPQHTVRHWWLNFSPAVWSLADADVGHTQLYTAQNEAGNNRQKYAHFQSVEPGDLVIGYESTPAKRIVGLCSVTRGLHATADGREAIEFEKTAAVTDGPTWTDLRAMPALEEAEPIQNNQGSLFSLSPDAYAEIVALLDVGGEAEVVDTEESPTSEPYTVADLASEAFADPAEVEAWVELLRRRKNLILQGPPGVGKTFLARRLAWALMGVRDPERVRFVQFHQSYAYEDFVQGYRPGDTGGFELKDGLFYEFVQAAKERPEEPHVFIIDEVNRGNLSKIFGELMMLIEPDKRGREFAIPLTYSKGPKQQFYVPDNVHLLGMMNTADRSLAVVDYALRRRFAFVTLAPAMGREPFQQFLQERGADASLISLIANRIRALNAKIASDGDLGAGFCVGHSYFCPSAGDDVSTAWYERVIRTEVGPLLREYWFDRPSEAEAAVAALLA
ncbi:MAG: AAA family ATPase [Rhodothermales bacterium]